MTKIKNTKRALLGSALALTLCISMLIGSTFAWFTDSVTSAGNTIQSGKLDVDLVDDAGNSLGGQVLKFVDQDNNDLWEPGCTYKLQEVFVANKGNLALKYKIDITGITGDKKLLEAIEWSVKVDGTETDLTDLNGYLLAGETSKGLVISGHMKESAGNEYQNLSIDGISITVTATQYTYEKDSFDDQYDANATLPVTDAASLKSALAEGKSVTLAKDMILNEKVEIPAGKDVVIDLGGKKLQGAFSNQGVSAVIENKGSLTIKNGTVVSLAQFPDTDWGTEGFPTYATNTISNRGKLVIGEGTVIENQTNVGGASYAVDNYAGATLTVNGGTIKAQDVAIRMFSGSATAENKVVINDGTITGKRAIWIQLPSNNAAVAPKTTVEINGGTLKSTSDLTIYSYSYGNSFAATKVTFNGGTFEKDVAFGGGYKGDQETVIVNGGTFNGKLGRYLDNDGWVDIAKP